MPRSTIPRLALSEKRPVAASSNEISTSEGEHDALAPELKRNPAHADSAISMRARLLPPAEAKAGPAEPPIPPVKAKCASGATLPLEIAADELRMGSTTSLAFIRFAIPTERGICALLHCKPPSEVRPAARSKV